MSIDELIDSAAPVYLEMRLSKVAKADLVAAQRTIRQPPPELSAEHIRASAQCSMEQIRVCFPLHKTIAAILAVSMIVVGMWTAVIAAAEWTRKLWIFYRG